MDSEYKTIQHDSNTRRYFWRQLFVCITTTTFYFMIGLTIGAPTVALPQLQAESNSTSDVSVETVSWINSVVPFSAVFWVLTLIIVAHYFGRRKPMILISVNAFVAYVVFSCSKTVSQLLIAQLIQGLTQATFATTSSMVVTEYTTPSYRGLFLGFFHATHFWGIWVANTIGIFSNYRNIGLVGIACAIYAFVAFLFIPESPYWLACQGRYDECAKVHRWLRGLGEDAENELKALIKSAEDLKLTVKSKMPFKAHVSKYMQILKDPEIYKPLGLILITIMGNQMCGKMACAVYALEIMKKVTQTKSDAIIGVLVLDAVSVAGLYVGSFVSRKFKRRTLLVSSSSICALFLFCLSCYLYLVRLTILSESSYISIFLLVGFSLAACIGPLMTANQLTAELYPIKHRTFAMCIICVLTKTVYGSTLKMTPYIFKEFHEHGAFLFFAISFTVCVILWWKYMPETKDKTIQEISVHFATKNTNTEPSNVTRLL